MVLKQLNLFSPSEGILKKRPNFGINLTTDDRVCHTSVRLTLALILTSIFVLTFTWWYLSPETPLFYSLPYGESQVTERFFLWLLPLGNLLVFFLNLTLANKIFQEERLLAQILILTASVVSFLSTITLIKIILLIT